MNSNLRLRVLPQVPSVNGKQIELGVTNTYIRWRYINPPFPPGEWFNLIALSELVGPAGPPIELRADSGFIEYRVVGTVPWIRIITLDDLRGEPGPEGPQGPSVSDGDKGAIVVSDSGTKWELARDRKTVALLIADTVFSYTEGEGKTLVAPGDIVTALGFRYEVAESGATDAHVETAGGVKLYVRPNGAVRPAMFGVLDDDSPAVDANEALQAMAAFCRAGRWGVKFGPREYRIAQQLEFNASVFGVPGLTKIQYTGNDTETVNAVLISGGGVVRDIVVDGNVSADPVAWDSSNYDSFTGARGLVIRADRVHVENVIAQNTRRACFDAASGKQISFKNCLAQRARGNFGDGFLVAQFDSFSYENCRATDVTRIGFVSDIFAAASTSSRGLYRNCVAEDGHDASVLYGGIEYNVGFWSENSGQIVRENCSVSNFVHGCLRDVAGGTGGTANEPNKGLFYSKNCIGSQVAVGVVAQGIGGQVGRFIYDNCYMSATGSGAFDFSSNTNSQCQFEIRKGGSRLSGTSTARSSVKAGAGELIIRGFQETWATLDTTLLNANDNYYGSLSHFNNASEKVVVEDWVTLLSDGSPAPMRIKFQVQALNTLDLSVIRCKVRDGIINAANLYTEEVTFDRLGNVAISGMMHISGGEIRDRLGGTALTYRSPTRKFLLSGVRLDFIASGGSLSISNANSSNPVPLPVLEACRFVKDVAVSGSFVNVTGDASVINVTDANHVIANHCVFANTGASTANPVFNVTSPTNAASKVHGKGNLKSSNLSVVAAAGKVATTAVFENWG